MCFKQTFVSDVEPEKSSPVDSDKNSAGSDMSVSFDELGGNCYIRC